MAANSSEFQEELQKLEQKHADNPDGRYFVPLATAYRKAGEVDRAIELLREGLEKNPEYLSAHIVLGRCLSDREDDAGARREFDYVLQLDPQNLVALRSLGEIAMSSGNYRDARRHYDQLLTVDPMNEDARRALEKLDSAPEPYPADSAQTEPVDSMETSVSPQAAPPPVPSWPEDEDDFDAPRREAAVVTETIAELYTRQGFYDRAVEVYRELIRRRGPEPELEERLARVERLLSGISDSPARAPSPAEVPEPLDEEPFAATPEEPSWETESGDDGLVMEGYSATSYLDETLAVQSDDDRPIGEFLLSVLTWKPGTTGGVTENAAEAVQPAPEPAPTDVGLVEGFDSDRLGWMDEAPASQPASTPAPDRSRAPFGDDDVGLEPPLSAGMDEPAVDSEPAPPAEKPAPAAEQDLGEDDLESFQEWLRSLKR